MKLVVLSTCAHSKKTKNKTTIKRSQLGLRLMFILDVFLFFKWRIHSEHRKQYQKNMQLLLVPELHNQYCTNHNIFYEIFNNKHKKLYVNFNLFFTVNLKRAPWEWMCYQGLFMQKQVPPDPFAVYIYI